MTNPGRMIVAHFVEQRGITLSGSGVRPEIRDYQEGGGHKLGTRNPDRMLNSIHLQRKPKGRN